MKKKYLAALFSVLAATGMAASNVSAQDSDHLNRTIETFEKGDPAFGLFTGNFSLANARGLARSGLD